MSAALEQVLQLVLALLPDELAAVESLVQALRNGSSEEQAVQAARQAIHAAADAAEAVRFPKA